MFVGSVSEVLSITTSNPLSETGTPVVGNCSSFSFKLSICNKRTTGNKGKRQSDDSSVAMLSIL